MELTKERMEEIERKVDDFAESHPDEDLEVGLQILMDPSGLDESTIAFHKKEVEEAAQSLHISVDELVLWWRQQQVQDNDYRDVHRRHLLDP